MNNFSWSDTALGDLKVERDATVNLITQLEAQLQDARERQQLLQDTILGIEQLAPSPQSADPNKKPQPLPSDSQLPIHQSVPGTRTRTTSPQQVLVYVLREHGAEMTRDELFNELQERNLVPASWVNPRNAFTTTLGRAVKRGVIKQDGDKYSLAP